MEAKQEGGSFLKRLQNKLKNLKSKLEKIEAKEKRPAAELSQDEQNMLSSKPQVLKLIQEYEHLVASCPLREGLPAAAPEVRVETRVVDYAPEIVRLWLTLHYVALEGVRDAYVAQGLPLQDFEEVLQARKTALGQPEQPVQDVLGCALQLFTKYRQPSNPEDENRKNALNRVSDWVLTQHIPSPRELTVATFREVRQIIKEPEPLVVAEPAAPQVQQPIETVEETRVSAEQGLTKTEEAKEQLTAGRWAEEEDEEEEPAAEEGKEQQQMEKNESGDFVLVTGRPKKRKEAAPVPEVRESRGGRPRRGRRGDRRPRGWHGAPPAPQ